MVEQMLRWFAACHEVRSVALRYFNAAGVSADARLGEDSPTPLNLVPVAMQAALGQIPALPVYGTDYPTPDGSAIRDYVHVDDLADADVRALRYLESGGDTTVVNVGTGQGSSVLEVVAATKRASGIDFAMRLQPRRPGDPSAVYADHRRAARDARMGAEARARRHRRQRLGVALLPSRGLPDGAHRLSRAAWRRGVLLPGPAVGHPPCARRRSRVECEWWAQCGCWRGARSGDAGGARWRSRCWWEWSVPWCSRRPPGPAAAAPRCHGSTRSVARPTCPFSPAG